MDKEKLKLIIRQIELLIDSLKVEIYSDVNNYKVEDNFSSFPTDYDEIFDENE